MPTTTNAIRQMAEKGSWLHSTAENSLMPIGVLIMTDIRKNHFIKVMLLYRAVKGLTVIKNKPKDNAFIIIKTFPSGIFWAFVLDDAVNTTKTKAPISPKIAPEAFSQVIFSRIKIADKIKTKIGEMVTITEELIGVDKLKPLNDKSILITIPNNVQAIIRGQSLLRMGSDLTKILMIQNKIAAPKTLSITNPKGWM